MTVICRTDISIFVCMSRHETSYSKKTGCSNDGRGFCLSATTLTVITVFASSSRQASEHLLKKKRMCMMPHCRNFFCVSIHHTAQQRKPRPDHAYNGSIKDPDNFFSDIRNSFSENLLKI